jgi:glycosyltransferase involved in cell wall biosynthesis
VSQLEESDGTRILPTTSKPTPRRIIVLIPNFPSVVQTFVAQELLGLQQAGLQLQIRPLLSRRDERLQLVSQEITQPVHYPDRNLISNARQIWSSWHRFRKTQGYREARSQLINRPALINLVLFCRALMLANKLDPDGDIIYAQFIRHPATVAQFASLITGTPWACTAHARDIWLSDNADLAQKLETARWMSTCNGKGAQRLKKLSPRPHDVHLVYHGVDLERFPANSTRKHTSDGSSPHNPVRLLTAGRAVEKKGFDILLDALARLPDDLHWRLDHVGSGALLKQLGAQAEKLGIADKVKFNGFQTSDRLIELYRECDIFVLPSRIDSEGDMDGLPNVLVEAASQAMMCISTDISAIPEFFTSGENGLLTAADNIGETSAAIQMAIASPGTRQKMGSKAASHVRLKFDHSNNVRLLVQLFEEIT